MPNDALPRHASYDQGGVGLPRALTRWLGPNVVRNPDRVYTVIFVAGGRRSSAPPPTVWPMGVPSALLFPVVVAAGVVVSGRGLLVVYALTLGFLVLWMPDSGLTKPRAALVILSFLAVMVLMYYAARSRSLIGTRGFGADRMFAELRDRIALVGRVPVLPEGWRAWSCILLRARRPVLRRLRRGAPERLRAPARDRPRRRQRQGHPRGHPVAAAVRGARRAARAPSRRVTSCGPPTSTSCGRAGRRASPRRCTSTSTCAPGSTRSRNAGHPSPARYTSGRARWTVLDGARGPLLGVVPGASFPRQSGRLDRGDALLFYSDGVIEARGRDLTDGIDRMLGVAAMSVLGEGDVAREVCESARSGEDDDRAALAVRRL